MAAVFSGAVAGQRGTYAVDAGTGRTVRLDDLPGLEAAGEFAWWSVSPNGRWLVSDHGVVDLEIARVRPLGTPGRSGQVVLDDGTAVTTAGEQVLRIVPAAGPARTIDLGVAVIDVAAQSGGAVVVRHASDRSDETLFVVDVASGRATRWEVPGAPTALVAFAGGGLVDEHGVRHGAGDPAASWGAETPLRELVASAAGPVVAIGPDDAGPVAIRRAQPPGPALRWETLTSVRLDIDGLALAADPLTTARPVDVREPRWAVVAADGVRTVAARTLAGGAAVLFLLGFVVALTRRPRPFAARPVETGSFTARARDETGDAEQ